MRIHPVVLVAQLEPAVIVSGSDPYGREFNKEALSVQADDDDLDLEFAAKNKIFKIE